MVLAYWRAALIVVALGVVTSTASAQMDVTAPAPEIGHGLVQGYLHEQKPLNSVVFVPSPPESGSPRQAADDAVTQGLMSLRGSTRWDLAARDAELTFPAAAKIFQCALGMAITEEETPALYRLMQRSLTDFGLATYPAKKAYQRARPFLVNGEEICTPEEREVLTTDGSYPSGHSAIGWGWALVLSQLAPERAERLLARGRAYAQSRIICNVHWMSDTEAGMAVGSAAFARLQNDTLFQATMAVAREEIARHMGREVDAVTCEAEAAALSLGD
ncbi:MAG: phosphatase PAP2 family protein [Gammaproteobacteria bacterium]